MEKTSNEGKRVQQNSDPWIRKGLQSYRCDEDSH